MDACREYGSSGLSRDAALLYADDNAACVAYVDWPWGRERLYLPLPSASRCGACGYRADAPGHLTVCG